MKTTLSELYYQSVEPQRLLPRHIDTQLHDEDGYWLYLKRGWSDADEIGPLHCIHEDTKREAYRHQVIRCFCKECQ